MDEQIFVFPTGFQKQYGGVVVFAQTPRKYATRAACAHNNVVCLGYHIFIFPSEFA